MVKFLQCILFQIFTCTRTFLVLLGYYNNFLLYRNFTFDFCLIPLLTILQLYCGGQVIGGGNWRTRRKSLTYRNSLTNLSHNVVHLALIKIKISGVIGTDCIGSYKSNYHTITATIAPITFEIQCMCNMKIILGYFGTMKPA